MAGQLQELDASAESAQRALAIAVSALQAQGEVTNILSSAEVFLEAIMLNPDHVSNATAAAAVDVVYAAEAVMSHDLLKSLRNNIHDVLILSCCRGMNIIRDGAVERDTIVPILCEAFGRPVDATSAATDPEQLYSRLFNSRRHVRDGGPPGGRRPRPRRPRRPREQNTDPAQPDDVHDTIVASVVGSVLDGWD